MFFGQCKLKFRHRLPPGKKFPATWSITSKYLRQVTGGSTIVVPCSTTKLLQKTLSPPPPYADVFEIVDVESIYQGETARHKRGVTSLEERG